MSLLNLNKKMIKKRYIVPKISIVAFSDDICMEQGSGDVFKNGILRVFPNGNSNEDNVTDTDNPDSFL